MLKELYRKNVLLINLIGLIIGLIFLVLSSIGIFLSDMDFAKDNEFLQSFFDAMGNYIHWVFIGVITLTIACGWIFGDLMLKQQQFKKLIDTGSKAIFVRNLVELEELAWKLGPKYMDIVYERKKKFRIK